MGYNSKVKIENNYELFTIFWSFHFSYVLLHHSNGKCCCCSSVVEHFLGKEEVTSSILVNSSQSKDYVSRNPFFISAERPDREQAERTAAVRRLRRCPMRKMQAGEGRWLPRRQMRRCTLGSAGHRDAASHAEVSGRAAASGRRKATKQTIRSPIAAQSANTAPKMDYPSRSFAVTLPCK